MKHVAYVIKCSRLSNLEKTKWKKHNETHKFHKCNYTASENNSWLCSSHIIFFLIKQTFLSPCPLALEKYPDVSGSRQLPRQNAPTLSMCFQGFHWLFPPQFCLLLFWERREKTKNTKIWFDTQFLKPRLFFHRVCYTLWSCLSNNNSSVTSPQLTSRK